MIRIIAGKRKKPKVKRRIKMKKILNTEHAPKAIGPYVQGVDTGNLLFLSGKIPIDPAVG